MSTSHAGTARREDRVLILAPSGRDAQLAAAALEKAGVSSHVCADVEELCVELERGAAAVLLTEEAIGAAARKALAAVLVQQPLWSDIPVVVVATRAATAGGRRRLIAAVAELGNVTLLERPIAPDTLVSALGAALRARDRQYQARQLLERLEENVRERDRFLAMLSHELRNPLGAIRNAMELLRRVAGASDDLERPLTIVARQTQHLSRLIDDLLDVSRVTTGKVTLKLRPLDLRTIIQQAIEQLEDEVAKNGLRLLSSLGSRPLPVSGDPVRLEQVFTNLLTNAIKYTPAGGRIEVTVSRDDSEVKVRVADNGIGIAPEMVSSIFQLFAQVDRSLDRSQGGLGIGLSLVRSLLTLHGGTVTVHSDGPGKGSEFVVMLPIGRAEDVASRPAPAVKPATRQHQLHILLVEDNDDNREALKELLELEGYRVDIARDGTAGVEQAVALRPDIAIVDIGLPGISGYEVARQVRGALGRNIALIALTGYGQPEDRQRTLEAGFDAHLTKPVGYSELAETLRSWSGPG